MMRTVFSCLFLGIACGAAMPLASAAPTAEEARTPGGFPAAIVDEVIVPVPSEVFSVLDKLGNPNWKDEIRLPEKMTSTDRTLLALRLGAVVAEGFIAVQANDKASVESIGKDVLDLAGSLGLRSTVVPHCQTILDAARDEDWKTIRRELDKTQTTVRETMRQMKDEPLAQCVSIGGWLRGTEAATDVIAKDYSADRAELLNQPLLVEHFEKSIESMPNEVRKHELLSPIASGLGEIRKLLPAEGTSAPEDAVKKIRQICATLSAKISGS